jgi:hypothetical protein
VLEDIARMGIFGRGHLSLSVIIDDLGIMRLAIGPTKADAPTAHSGEFWSLAFCFSAGWIRRCCSDIQPA